MGVRSLGKYSIPGFATVTGQLHLCYTYEGTSKNAGNYQDYVMSPSLSRRRQTRRCTYLQQHPDAVITYQNNHQHDEGQEEVCVCVVFGVTNF